MALIGLAILQGALFFVYRSRENVRAVQGTVHFEDIRGRIQAPAVRVEHVDGRVDLLAAAGAPTLVHFWVTWCPPCRQELPLLLQLSRSRGIRLIAIATDPRWTSVRAFFRGRIPPEVVRDVDGRAHEAYGVTTLPDTYLVGPDGLLLLRFAGAQDWSAPEVVNRLIH